MVVVIHVQILEKSAKFYIITNMNFHFNFGFNFDFDFDFDFNFVINLT